MKDFKLSEGSSVLLDLIRGFSAQMVVVGHGISFFGVFKSFRPPEFPWVQNIAVLVFFLLSGYLITYSVVRKITSDKKYSFKLYFIDRFTRIYMALIPALIFIFFLDFLSQHLNPGGYGYNNAFDGKTFFGNILMFQDYPLLYLFSEKIPSFGSARVLWTLAIEWWIYLFFGYLVLVFCKRTNLKSLLVLAFFSIVPLYNLIDGRGNGLMMSWLFGSCVYLLSTLPILKFSTKKAKIVVLIVLFLFAQLRITATMQEYEPIFAFLLAMILWFLLDLIKDIKFNRRVIDFIRFNASYSYTLYLVHYSVLYFLSTHFKNENPYALFALGFVFSNIISILIGRYSEITLTRTVKKQLYEFAKSK